MSKCRKQTPLDAEVPSSGNLHKIEYQPSLSLACKEVLTYFWRKNLWNKVLFFVETHKHLLRHLCDAVARMKLENVKTRTEHRRALVCAEPPSPIASSGGCSLLGAAEVIGDASLWEQTVDHEKNEVRRNFKSCKILCVLETVNLGTCPTVCHINLRRKRVFESQLDMQVLY